MSKKRVRGTIRKRGKSWQVDCGEINGNRVRRSFSSKEQATEWRRLKNIELDNNRYAVFELSDAHRFDALEAYRSLARASNIPVEELPQDELALDHIVNYYLKHTQPEGPQCKLSEVAELYLETKLNSGLRPATIKDLRARLKTIVQVFGDRPAHLISAADMEGWLNRSKFSMINRKNYIVHLVMLFNFAKERKYIKENQASLLKKPKSDDKMPESLSVDECNDLLTTATKIGPMMIPYFALSMFAGLRPSECQQLNWKSIKLDRKIITIRPETAKGRRVRHVDISDNLVAWLAPFRQEDSTIYFSRVLFDRIRKKSGVSWTNSILRHTYATHHVAMYEDAAKTSLQMGHRDPNVLFNHYRELTTREEAQLFWKIKPSGKKQIIPFAKEAG